MTVIAESLHKLLCAISAEKGKCRARLVSRCNALVRDQEMQGKNKTDGSQSLTKDAISRVDSCGSESKSCIIVDNKTRIVFRNVSIRTFTSQRKWDLATRHSRETAPKCLAERDEAMAAEWTSFDCFC
jgi:hypothetical protein